jgi:hypothetical protein
MKKASVMSIAVTAVLIVSVFSSLAHGQVMTMEFEGDGEILGNLSVGGTIAAGSQANILTNPTGYLIGSMIQSASIGSTQLASYAVTESKIGLYAITNTRIGGNAISSVKIQSAAVTPEKLSTTATYSDDDLYIADRSQRSLSHYSFSCCSLPRPDPG